MIAAWLFAAWLAAVQSTDDGVLFQCETNGARLVYLAGDFNDWAHNDAGKISDPACAMTESNGVWRKTVKLAPGTYRFKFNLDGESSGWFTPAELTDRDADGNALFRVRPTGVVEVRRAQPPRKTEHGVVFECLAPAAHIVYLAGDFNDWGRNRDGLVFDPQFAMMLSGGVWRAAVALLPGKHEYQFVIDGDRWQPRATVEVK
jgi:1,4-alpha-glucan branching enzyme